MSRSYKKHKIIKGGGYVPYKKIFNRRLRRSKASKFADIPKGSSYKKLNESWCIADWKFLNFTWKSWQKFHHDFYSSEEESREAYLKYTRQVFKK